MNAASLLLLVHCLFTFTVSVNADDIGSLDAEDRVNSEDAEDRVDSGDAKDKVDSGDAKDKVDSGVSVIADDIGSLGIVTQYLDQYMKAYIKATLNYFIVLEQAKTFGKLGDDILVEKVQNLMKSVVSKKWEARLQLTNAEIQYVTELQAINEPNSEIVEEKQDGLELLEQELNPLIDDFKSKLPDAIRALQAYRSDRSNRQKWVQYITHSQEVNDGAYQIGYQIKDIEFQRLEVMKDNFVLNLKPLFKDLSSILKINIEGGGIISTDDQYEVASDDNTCLK
ncbi:unnamed protein product [Schistosoma turkestanicum]|nr:unnamed protein product [Schistosoma turkestanicum]